MELPFIKLAATEVVSGVSGESENTIRDLFQLAKVRRSYLRATCLQRSKYMPKLI